MKIGIFWHWQLTPAGDDEVHMLKENIFLDNATKVDVMWNETQKQLLFFCDGWYGTITLEEDHAEIAKAEESPLPEDYRNDYNRRMKEIREQTYTGDDE